MNYMELSAITDTIHTKTVSGEKWCYIHLKYLDDTASNKSEIIPSNKTLKFRDERKVLLFQQKLVLFYLYFIRIVLFKQKYLMKIFRSPK